MAGSGGVVEGTVGIAWVSVVAGRGTVVVVDGAGWESREGLRLLTQPGNDFGNETPANG